MCKPVDYVVKNAKSLYVVGCVLVGLAAWLFMLNGLPARIDSTDARVTQLERDVADLKTGIAEQGVKMDLMLSGLYEVRGVLLKGK